MSYLLDDLTGWLAVNDPEHMPYWPGGHYTGGVGFRTSRELLEMGASPIHLGADRAGGTQYTMPFDGRIEWRMVGGAAGSLLRIIPEDDVRLELQVFHTQAGPYAEAIEQDLQRGEPLPVTPGDLGTSSGDHTHTEALMPADPDLREWLAGDDRPSIRDGLLDLGTIFRHCAENGLDECDFARRVETQVQGWWITGLWAHFGERAHLPRYRLPGWDGPTLHIDSRWLLRI